MRPDGICVVKWYNFMCPLRQFFKGSISVSLQHSYFAPNCSLAHCPAFQFVSFPPAAPNFCSASCLVCSVILSFISPLNLPTLSWSPFKFYDFTCTHELKSRSVFERECDTQLSRFDLFHVTFLYHCSLARHLGSWLDFYFFYLFIFDAFSTILPEYFTFLLSAKRQTLTDLPLYPRSLQSGVGTLYPPNKHFFPSGMRLKFIHSI